MPFRDLLKSNISKSEKKETHKKFNSVEILYDKNITKNINLLKSSLSKTKEFISLIENKNQKINDKILSPKILKMEPHTNKNPIIPPITLEKVEKPGYRSSIIFESNSPRKIKEKYSCNNFRKSPVKPAENEKNKNFNFRKLASDSKIFKVEETEGKEIMSNIEEKEENKEKEKEKPTHFINHFLYEVKDAIENSPRRKKKESPIILRKSDSDNLIKNLIKNTDLDYQDNHEKKDKDNLSNLSNLNFNAKDNFNNNENNFNINNDNYNDEFSPKISIKNKEIFENLDEIKKYQDMIDLVKSPIKTNNSTNSDKSMSDKLETPIKTNNSTNTDKSMSDKLEKKTTNYKVENKISNSTHKTFNTKDIDKINLKLRASKSKVFNSLNINFANLDFNNQNDISYITNKIQNKMIINSLGVNNINIFNIEGITENLKIEKVNVNPNIYSTSSDSKYLNLMKTEEESEEKKKKKNLKNSNSFINKLKPGNFKIPKISNSGRKESNKTNGNIPLPNIRILKSNNNLENLYKNFQTKSHVNLPNSPINSIENSSKQIQKINLDHLRKYSSQNKILKALEDNLKNNNNNNNKEKENLEDIDSKNSNKTDSFLNMKFEENLNLSDTDSEFSLYSKRSKKQKSLNSSLLHLNKGDVEEDVDYSYTETDSEEIKIEERDKVDGGDLDWKVKELLFKVRKSTVDSPSRNLRKYARKYSIYDKEILKFFSKDIKNEEFDPDVKQIYSMLFRKEMDCILELKKYIKTNSNQSQENKNIERRRFASKNYAHKYICDMKEKVHFMKGILDYTFSKVVTTKFKLKGENIMKNRVLSKLEKINDLRIDEIKELLIHISELKNLDLNNFIPEDVLTKNNKNDKDIKDFNENGSSEENENEENISIKKARESPSVRRSSAIKIIDNDDTKKINLNENSEIKYKPIAKIYEEIKQIIEKTDSSILKDLEETKNVSLLNFMENKQKLNKTQNFTGFNKNLSITPKKTNNSLFNTNFGITTKSNYNTIVKNTDLFSSLPQFYKNFKKESQVIDRNFKVNLTEDSPIKLPKIKKKKMSKDSSFKEKSKPTKVSIGVDYSANTTVKSPSQMRKSFLNKDKYYISLINFSGKHNDFNRTNFDNSRENYEDFLKLEYTDSEDESSGNNNFKSRKNKNFRNSMPVIKHKNTKEFDIESHTDFLSYKENGPIIEIENEEKFEEYESDKKNITNITTSEEVFNISNFMKLSTRISNYHSTDYFHNIESNKNVFKKMKTRKSSFYENSRVGEF